MSLVVQTLINGILFGGILGIAAVGFSLIFGVMGIINLTHGVTVILGAFLSFFALRIYQIDPFVSIVPIMVVLFVLGYLFQRVIINRILDEDVLVTLLVTFGFALMGRNLMEILVTATPRSINPSYARETVSLGILGSYSVVRVGGLVTAVVLFGALAWVIKRTDLGRKIRAAAEDSTVARLCGINTRHIYALTFGIGAALAGGGGVLVGMTTSFSPADEELWTMFAFIVVVLGGFGRPIGALLGGLIFGLAWSFTTVYVGAAFSALVGFLMLIVMLLVRPQGILGGWTD